MTHNRGPTGLNSTGESPLLQARSRGWWTGFEGDGVVRGMLSSVYYCFLLNCMK